MNHGVRVGNNHPGMLQDAENALGEVVFYAQAAGGHRVHFGMPGERLFGGEIAFTIECSVRSAWEAIHTLLKRGPPPPPVYQSQFDPKALFDALKVFFS